MNNKTVDTMYKALQQENQGIVIILEDTRKEIDRFLEKYEKLQESFTSRMDVEALSNDTLVAFGRQYAREREYSIDELGVLALYQNRGYADDRSCSYRGGCKRNSG